MTNPEIQEAAQQAADKWLKGSWQRALDHVGPIGTHAQLAKSFADAIRSAVEQEREEQREKDAQIADADAQASYESHRDGGGRWALERAETAEAIAEAIRKGHL